MQETIGNRLLSKLGRDGYQRLQPKLEQVTLHENQVLYALGEVVSHVYFPNDAIVSLLIEADEGRTVEVAMEGNEGAAGVAIYFGGLVSCNLSRVRHEGTAMRLPVSTLAETADRYGDLDDLMRRYVHALCMQIAQLGVCNRFHSFDARLARWLLMTHDRTGTRELNTTQRSIAQTLGVRRSTVTDAASGLLKKNIIDYRRGRIEILDPTRLRGASCPCYGIIKRQYDSFLD
jgi:CRP-like cAMP-binding protein